MNNFTMAAAASTGLKIIDISGFLGFYLELNIVETSATAAGSLKLQGTSKDSPVDADWQDIADSSATFTGDHNQAWNVSSANYDKVRAYLTLDSGEVDVAGLLTAKRG